MAASLVCQQAVELAGEYVEGTLSWRARRRYRRHVAACPHCHEYLEQLRDVIAAAGRPEADALSPDARDALVDLYRQWKAS